VVDVDELVSEKVYAAVQRPGADPLGLGKGRLFVRDGGLEFESAKGTLSMRPIRSITDGAGANVEFGEGGDLRTVTLSDGSKGILHMKSQSRVMAEELRQRLQMKGLTETETADRESVEVAVAQAGIRKAKLQMWVWGLVALAGTIATIATISAASEGGGSYYVFWGAIVFGIGGALAAYFDHYRKYRKILDRAEAGGRKASEPPS
jgi:hypothetical protein